MVKNHTEVDVLVVGSGVAGLAAAIAAAKQDLRVLVVEQSRYFGGTTAISAGWAWMPGNRVGAEAGDTREAAETYLRALAPDTFDSSGVAAFLDGVPEALDFFERETSIEFDYPPKAPDYQMDLPGARLGGRAILPQDADARILGSRRLEVQPYLSSYTVFGYMPQVGADISHFFHVNQSVRSFAYVATRLLKTWADAAIYRRPVQRSNGNALITRMMREALDLGVEMWHSTPATSLTSDSVGRATGATLAGVHHGVVEAKRGVVLAAGGFSGDRQLRREMFPHDRRGRNHFTPTVGHTGDAARLARDLGGHMRNDLSSVASWAPVTVFRYLRGARRLFPHLRAIGLPGLIAVDRDGRRFGNEALSYHDFGREMIAHDANEIDTYAWLVADSRTMHKYGIGYAKPWPMPRSYFYRTGFLIKAKSIEELADRIGADPRTLRTTLEEFSQNARKGEDPDFGRGSTEYNHFRGDPEHLPNPNLAPIDEPPFYAARIQMGDLGTFAGIATDGHARVVRHDQSVVPGLYAAGSAAASVFGGGYPGYGANIGPALVFGYRAGMAIAHSDAATQPSS